MIPTPHGFLAHVHESKMRKCNVEYFCSEIRNHFAQKYVNIHDLKVPSDIKEERGELLFHDLLDLCQGFSFKF